MISTLPETAQKIMDWPWSKIEPHFQELADTSLGLSNVHLWLQDWTRLSKLIHEKLQRLEVATKVDTTDQEAERAYRAFLNDIYPYAQAAEQTLKLKLLASGVKPPGFEVPLRNMRAEAALFREDNLQLLSEELQLITQFEKITGTQTVQWEGKEITILQIRPVYQSIDRERRKRAWRLVTQRQLSDRETINSLWVKFLELRRQLAANAELPNYRAFRWQQLLRFEYTPEDSKQFQRSIEEVVVPVAQRIHEKRRHRLRVDSLRPWDLMVDPLGRSPLRPFRTIEELEEKTYAIFKRLDPRLGEYFEIMRCEALLDLESRKGKAQGGYCTEFPVAERPFIFTNAVGLHDDVLTLLHEGGHAFHVFESSHLPYYQQLQVPIEFAEVASMGMELLAAPYLTAEEGGFYSPDEAARARVEHLEEILLFWPYMAVVDAFQHWVYENHDAATNPANCDAKWAELWRRFMGGEDWSGLEQEMMTGWQRKPHIHQDPFYYVEYGIAQLGAVQVWHNALTDQAEAVAAYRKALSLGGSVSLPRLFTTAGAKFAFETGTLTEAVALMEQTIAELESSQ